MCERKYGKDYVKHLIPDGNYDNMGSFDWNVWVDWGEDGLAKILTYQPMIPPKPNIYIASDTHIGYEYRLGMARKFDWVFCNQLRAVEEFVRDGIPRERCFWFPHAAEPLCYKKEEIIKDYDICFIGHVGDWGRVDFLDRMFREFPNFFYGQRYFEETSRIYNKSKIVISTAIKDDINMRVFESLSSGSFLLTQWVPTLELLFKDGVHLATWKTMDEAVEKAGYYLANDHEREKIAEAGHKEFLSKHTYEHRWNALMDVVTKKQETIQGGVL
jgi:glycosyltransferase involved in cell wall biosynthesis